MAEFNIERGGSDEFYEEGKRRSEQNTKETPVCPVCGDYLIYPGDPCPECGFPPSSHSGDTPHE